MFRLYLTFFQPVRKLVERERDGGRVTTRYDRAQTPYQRLVASGQLGPEGRAALEQVYQRLNPVTLKAQIDAELDTLWTLAE